MTPTGAALRRAAVVALLCVFLLTAAAPLRARGEGSPGFGGGSGSASPLSISIESNAFPGLPLVSHHVPRSSVVLDSSPSSAASATWFDTGPIGQLVASESGYTQPQYATSRYPGAEREQTVSVADESDPSGAWTMQAAVASASANEQDAQAASRILGLELVGSTSTPPAATAGTVPEILLRDAVAALRGALGASRPPAGGLWATSASEAAPLLSVGALAVSSQVDRREARTLAQTETLAEDIDVGGLLRIRSVRATATAASDGADVEGQPSLEVSGASLAGVPVEITKEGVRLADAVLPLGPGGAASVEQTLNEVLAAAGWSVALLDGSTVAEDGAVSVTAGGLQLRWQVPVPEGFAMPTTDLVMVIGSARAAAFGAKGAVARAGPVNEPAAGPPPSPALSQDDSLPSPPPAPAGGRPALAPNPAPAPAPTKRPDVDEGLEAAVSAPAAGATRTRRGGGAVLVYGLWQLVVLATIVEAVRASTPLREAPA